MKNLTLGEALGYKMILDFVGTKPTPMLLEWIARRPLGGMTLYRGRNIEEPAQVRELTSALQDAAKKAGQPPLLIATDQEGGQLNAIGGTATMFQGNMALGAAGSTDLARRVGAAIGRE